MTATMTILWITMLSGPMAGDVFGVPYTTEAACKTAMKTVSDTLDYDHNLQCETLPVHVEVEP
jgi:hypothetical protein